MRWGRWGARLHVRAEVGVDGGEGEGGLHPEGPAGMEPSAEHARVKGFVREVEGQLGVLEKQLYELETEYIEQTAAVGNLVVGFDAFQDRWVDGAGCRPLPVPFPRVAPQLTVVRAWVRDG